MLIQQYLLYERTASTIHSFYFLLIKSLDMLISIYRTKSNEFLKPIFTIKLFYYDHRLGQCIHVDKNVNYMETQQCNLDLVMLSFVPLKNEILLMMIK